jgi:aromatic-ring opening dioxygenase LigAB LigA subunit
MSRYEVDKLLRDLRRDADLAARFRSDVDAALDGYQLDTTERELLKQWNIRDLFERGANPLLLLLAHTCAGGSMRDYATLMNPGDRRKGE